MSCSWHWLAQCCSDLYLALYCHGVQRPAPPPLATLAQKPPADATVACVTAILTSLLVLLFYVDRVCFSKCQCKPVSITKNTSGKKFDYQSIIPLSISMTNVSTDRADIAANNNCMHF